jgi:hypothetical protein
MKKAILCQADSENEWFRSAMSLSNNLIHSFIIRAKKEENTSDQCYSSTKKTKQSGDITTSFFSLPLLKMASR